MTQQPLFTRKSLPEKECVRSVKLQIIAQSLEAAADLGIISRLFAA
jgi:hypothetical protein